MGNGDIKAVKALLAAGAEVNAKDITNRTPLDVIFAFSHQEIEQLLRKHGAKTGKELDAEAKQNKAKQKKKE